VRRRFAIDTRHEADCVVSDAARIGEIYHADRNIFGGANLTPIARYFAWLDPGRVEAFHEHWHVDCFVREHPLSPEPAYLGDALAKALLREGLCAEPLWVSWHKSQPLQGKAFGEVFDLE
jgi:hypothetical protein